MKRKWQLCTFALAILLVGGFLHHPIDAQEGANEERLTIAPAITKPEISSGEVYNDSLKVINDGSVDYTFRVYSAPFSVKDEVYDPDFVTINERTRAFEWVTFSQETYSIAVGEQIEVPYTITAPENAPPGGHYAVIFVETDPQPGSQIARKKRVGNLLYATVDGDIQEAGNLEGITLPLLHHTPPVVADIRLRNTGNVHFDASAQTIYKGLFGRQYLAYNQEAIIMPGTTRRISMTWENPPYLGVFKVSSKVSFLGNTEELPTKYIILLPIPVRIFAGVLLLTIVVLSILRKKPKKQSKKNDDTKMESKEDAA